MSENEIKPVAWCAPDSLNAAKFGGLAMITSNNKHGCSEPLYDQSAIDRLTAERDAAVADACRYRWLRKGLDSDTENGLEVSMWTDGFGDPIIDEELDAAIDTAMKEQEQGK